MTFVIRNYDDRGIRWAATMKAGKLLLCTALLVCAGCDRSPSHLREKPRYTISGQWRFNSGPGGPDITAGLVSADGVVTGKATVYGCDEREERTDLTGTVSQEGDLTLKTGLLQNGVSLVLEGKLGADGLTFGGITRSSLFASCRASQPGPTRGVREPLAYGEYAGTLLSLSNGSRRAATVSLQQHTPFGPGGNYPVQSSLSLPDSGCLGAAALPAQRSSISGDVLTAAYKSSSGDNQTVVTLRAVLVKSRWALSVSDIAVKGGVCDGLHGMGTLVVK